MIESENSQENTLPSGNPPSESAPKQPADPEINRNNDLAAAAAVAMTQGQGPPPGIQGMQGMQNAFGMPRKIIITNIMLVLVSRCLLFVYFIAVGMMSMGIPVGMVPPPMMGPGMPPFGGMGMPMGMMTGMMPPGMGMGGPGMGPSLLGDIPAGPMGNLPPMNSMPPQQTQSIMDQHQSMKDEDDSRKMERKDGK